MGLRIERWRPRMYTSTMRLRFTSFLTALPPVVAFTHHVRPTDIRPALLHVHDSFDCDRFRFHICRRGPVLRERGEPGL